MKISVVPRPKKMILLSGCAPDLSDVKKTVDSRLGDEAYTLRIDTSGIHLCGGSARGLVHAEATLRQIVSQVRAKASDPAEKLRLPALYIEDEPAYPMRSFHVDVVRHFFSIEEMKRFVDCASLFKFSQLHWHLSDDQGYRIESRVFPLLQKISAFRDGDHFGRYSSDEREGGYYTQQEIRDFVAYAAEKGIDVVPEIDLPGHVVSILAAYPHLSCRKLPMKVYTKQGITPYILCAGQEETFEFVEKLLREIMDLFPSKYIHIGGDEAPKEEWENCPACRARLESLGLPDFDALQGWFTNRIADFLLKNGRTPIVWNEAAYGKNLDPRVLVQSWTQDKDHAMAEHIRKGGKVLMATMVYCYCDYPYSFITLRNLQGIDLTVGPFTEGAEDLWPEGAGERLSMEGEGLSEEEAEKYSGAVLGSECLIWTEHIRTEEKLENFAWPRFAGSAEASWCGNDRPSFEDFEARLRDVYPVFAECGIRARDPEDWAPDAARSLEEMEYFRKNFFMED